VDLVVVPNMTITRHLLLILRQLKQCACGEVLWITP
jgi:hypothetical protein